MSARIQSRPSCLRPTREELAGQLQAGCWNTKERGMVTHKNAKHEDKTEREAKSGAAGRKGVSQEQIGAGKKEDPNNFANDKERASAAGKKGGRSSH
jgi:general stress protein YciG